MTSLADPETGMIIDVVEGRIAASVAQRLVAKAKWWRRRVKAAAIEHQLRDC